MFTIARVLFAGGEEAGLIGLRQVLESAITLILASIVPFLAPLPIQALGLIVGPLQAFIFMTLTAIYLASATAVDEHH